MSTLWWGFYYMYMLIWLAVMSINGYSNVNYWGLLLINRNRSKKNRIGLLRYVNISASARAHQYTHSHTCTHTHTHTHTHAHTHTWFLFAWKFCSS